MNMSTFRDLRAIHPRSDVIALATMANDDLRVTLFACKVLYAGRTYVKGTPEPIGNDIPPHGGREKAIREILKLRAKHDGYTDAERAAVDVGDDDEWLAA